MDFWPWDGRKPVTNTLVKKKQKAIESSSSYPLVNYNTANFLTLVEKNGQFKWTSIIKGENPNKLRADQCHLAFPPTRPLPVVLSKISAKRHAEQGACFIRTYYPYVDVPAELLVEQAVESREIGKFDQSEGTLLDSVMTSDPSSGKQAYLAFPMGELRRNLNLSPLHYSEEGCLVFRPSTVAAKTFQTPILQVVGSRPSDSQERHGSYGQDSYFANSCPAIESLVTLSSSDVGGQAVWDVRLNSQLEAYLVNGRGTVYYGDFSRGCSDLNMVRQEVDTTGELDHQNFWRVALGSGPFQCTLTSGNEAFLLDCRANSSLKLLSLDVMQDVFTSVEDESPNGMIRLCTTGQILWIDKRYPTRPLLGFKHGRNLDYTLQTHTIPCERDLTILTSKKNSLMTVYDVSKLPGYPLSIHDCPYSLHSWSGCGKSNLGQLSFRHPHSFSQSSFTLFRMYDRGDITCFDLLVPSGGKSDMVLEWSDQVEALKVEADNRQEEIGPLEMRERKEVDFSMAYEQLFHYWEEEREKTEEAGGEIIYGIVEQAVMFWQKAEIPEEQVLTTFDVLFRAGEMPQGPSNSDFLSDTIINSERVYQALAQERLSSELIGKGSVWHHDISPTLRHFIPEATQNVQTLTGLLSQLDLKLGRNRTYKSIKREIRAKEQLALDIVLASNIYSSHPFAIPKPKTEDLESLAEALSLDNDALPVQFGYLRPIRQDASPAEANDIVTCSPGIRLLLKEWTTGADPKDHYREMEGLEERGAKAKTKPFGVEDTATKATRPPTIVEAGMVALPPIPETASSQPVEETRGSPPFSQEIMASTQVLPGRYGGRSGMSKKKGAKKRLGGF